MEGVEIQKEDSVAIIWLDQPNEKVNKLSLKMIDDFKLILDSLEQDQEVKAVVLISKKEDNFIAGADLDMIQQISRLEDAQELSRQGSSIIHRLANFPKPFVAAINGAALGGGLEVALACHYRIATDHPKTVMALPEVQLGLLPGGGGTQRLPRLIGIQKALDMMLTGRNIFPHKAKKMGLVDDIIHPHGLLGAAKQAALRIAEKPVKRKRKKNWMEKILESNGMGRSVIYKQARKVVYRQTYGNYPAPLKIIECVEGGMGKSIVSGLALESKKFGELVISPESRQLIHLFFNMTNKKKNPLAEKVRPISCIGILGAGFMGAGIANVTATKKIKTILKDISLEAAVGGEKMVWEDLHKKVKKKAMNAFDLDVIMSDIVASDNYHGFDKTDVVIEAVFEDLGLKRKVLAETEAAISAECVFASNTSSLPITDIAAEARHPERVLGMHYFSPVTKMPLLEIITTSKTEDWATATAYELGLKQGKTIIVVNDGPGFYTTRVLAPLMNEAICILNEGGKIEDIDRAMKKFGFPVGPLALFDEVGIDVAAHVSHVMGEFFSKRGVTPTKTIEKVYEAGYQGRKNNQGFYSYPQGKKKGKKEVNSKIYSFFGGSSRKIIPMEDIQKRIAFALITEATYCLEDGTLKSPHDGDIGAIFGMGFPPFLGGPFRYLDSLGLDKAVALLQELTKKHDKRFTPCPMLCEMAKNNKKFYSGE